MLAANFISFLSSINIYKKRFDDDFVDHMNSYWSALLMIIFAIAISMKQMVGQSISCWFPAEFPDAWAQYAENYCWVKNTYFVKTNESIPINKFSRQKAELSYYQWVPFVLALQGLLFYLPAMFWRLVNWQTGVNIESLVKIASEIGEMEIGKKEKEKPKDAAVGDTLNQVVKFGMRLRERKASSRTMQAKRIFVSFSGNQRLGNYLVLMYMITKLFYLGSIIFQLYIVKAFTGMRHSFYGIDMLREITTGKTWHVTGHFPRITICDFTVRALGNWHKYTVQCVLSDNMLNEKIYIFIFFWLLLMATLTAMSIIYWFFRCFLQSNDCLLKKHIEENELKKRGHLCKILADNLKGDGLFILHLMSFNVSDVNTGRVINYLWENEKEEDERTKSVSSSSPKDEVPLTIGSESA